MWKIFLGFIIFAALSLFVIMKGGDNLDMSGEKHGVDTSHEVSPAPATPAATPAAAPTDAGNAAPAATAKP